MSRKDVIARLREVLVRRREALVMALRGDRSLLEEIAQSASGDEIDFAIDSNRGEIYSRLAEAESRELAHIQIALEKIADGSYGRCEGCDCSIPVPRLEVVPYTTLCIECKRKVETGVINANPRNDWSQIDDRQPLEGIRLSELDFNG